MTVIDKTIRHRYCEGGKENNGSKVTGMCSLFSVNVSMSMLVVSAHAPSGSYILHEDNVEKSCQLLF